MVVALRFIPAENMSMVYRWCHVPSQVMSSRQSRREVTNLGNRPITIGKRKKPVTPGFDTNKSQKYNLFKMKIKK